MRIVFALLFICLHGAAQAGTFDTGTSGACQLRFDGPLAQGDANRLAERLDAFTLSEGDTKEQFLCLSGADGALAEALRMGWLLRDHGIGTRIEAGQECLGSCAILFMAGSRVYYDDFTPDVVARRFSNRVMHATARLGFLRPRFRPGNANAAADFAAALDATLGLVELASQRTDAGTLMPPDLLAEIFADRGGDLFFIRTTGQSARWRIDVEGLDLPPQLTPVAAWHACANLGVWQLRYDPTPFDFDDTAVRKLPDSGPDPIYEVFGPLANDAEHYCLLQYWPLDDRENALFGCGVLGDEGLVIGRQDCYSPDDTDRMDLIDADARAFLPPNTPLASVAEARDGGGTVTSRGAAPQSSSPDPGTTVLHIPGLSLPGSPQDAAFDTTDKAEAFRAQCAANTGDAFITNVQTFANLRPQATVGGSVLEQVSRDTPVRITAGMSPDLAGISPACSELCSRTADALLSSTEQARLNACYDDNAFWYEVRTPSGKVGFLSGKFLRK